MTRKDVQIGEILPSSAPSTPPPPSKLGELLGCGHSVPITHERSKGKDMSHGMRSVFQVNDRSFLNTPAFRARAFCDECREEIITMQIDHVEAAAEADDPNFSAEKTIDGITAEGISTRLNRHPAGSGLMACGHLHRGEVCCVDGQRSLKLNLLEQCEDTIEGRSGLVCNDCRDANILNFLGPLEPEVRQKKRKRESDEEDDEKWARASSRVKV